MRKLDGTGKIWDDTWADKRVNLMPPHMAALLVLFGRNHNVRIVFGILLLINRLRPCYFGLTLFIALIVHRRKTSPNKRIRNLYRPVFFPVYRNDKVEKGV